MNVSSVQKQAKDRHQQGAPRSSARCSPPETRSSTSHPWPESWALSAAALEDFAYGRAGLAPEVLEALAKILFDGNAAYDPAIDMLRPVKREEPRPLGIHPPPITETMTLPSTGRSAAAAPGMDAGQAKARRPGWVE